MSIRTWPIGRPRGALSLSPFWPAPPRWRRRSSARWLSSSSLVSGRSHSPNGGNRSGIRPAADHPVSTRRPRFDLLEACRRREGPNAVTSILSVRDLEKSFGRVIAARDISLDVPVEQTIGIIGANGAGKTTFINMITGHLRPTKGSIAFEGREITGRAPREITRLGIARSFQVAQIFPSLTLFENMCAAAAVARGPDSTLRRALMALRSPRIVAEAEALLTLFGIARYADHRAATLPQGVRKLLDIGMALAAWPRLLLLDEPTSGISIEEKYDIMSVVISALKARRITVL